MIWKKIVNKMKEVTNKMAKNSSLRNFTKNINRWINSQKQAGLYVNTNFEGIKYTKSGTISSSSSEEALTALGKYLGGTAKQLAKKSPETFKARQDKQKEINEANARAKLILDINKQRDKAWEEFNEYYEGSSNKLAILLERDAGFKRELSDWGKSMRAGNDTAEAVRNMYGILKDRIAEME